MMRILLVAGCAFSLFFLTSCASDFSNQSDDEIAAESENTPSADAATDAATDSAAADSGAPAKEDLSNELNNADQAANSSEPSEQGLEDELDKNPMDGEKKAEDQSQTPPENQGSQEITSEPPAATEPPAPPVAVETAPQAVRITNIRYLSNQAGGTVVVEGTGPLSYHSHSEGSQFVIDVDNAELPDKLKKSTNVRDFSGAFTSIQAEQSSPTQARIVVQMRSGKGGEPVVQTEGNSLLVVPTSAPIVAEGRPAPEAAPAPVDESPLAAHTLDEFLTGTQKFYGKPISVQTKDADVRDVINFISEESGANIIMSDDVKGKISVKIRRIPWDQALVSVMRTKALGYVRQGNVIRISTLDELQKESDAAIKMIEVQKNLAPIRVKVIPVNYASIEDLVKQLPNFLTKEGKAVGDPRTNTILLTDRENVLERVEKIIKALDIQPSQVQIEGKIVEAQETFSSFVGVNWGTTGAQTVLSSGGGYNGAPIQFQPTLSSTSFNSSSIQSNFASTIEFGTLDVIGSLTAALQLAESEQQVRILSAPRVTTMNKEKAQITQGDQIITITNVVTPGTTTVMQTPVRTDLKLELSVTPQITPDGSVIMDMDVERDFPGAIADSAGDRAIEKRIAHSKVLVRNGQTAVVGGIYQNTETVGDQGVPGLMDIPIVGWLFKSRQKDRQKNELLIFLTPRILQQTLAHGNPTEAAG